ncbi:MAG TPA: metallophosphoesterase, partial [Catenuloplanes sp.]
MVGVLGFVGVMALVTGLIHLYLWKRLVRDTMRAGWPRRVGGLLMVALALLVPATLASSRVAGVHWLAWPGYLWLALMFYLLVILLVIELPMLAARLWLRRGAGAPPAETAAREPALAGATAAPAEPT